MPKGYPLYVGKAGAAVPADAPNFVVLPEELSYLGPGDVLGVGRDGERLAVLWRRASRQNALLLTEQCDNYCLMCSQPPKDRDDSWLLAQAREVLALVDQQTPSFTFTGGEPTLYGQQFIDLLEFASSRLPDTHIHVLTNGRRFANRDFALAWAGIDNPQLMAGIPIYGTEPSLHDYIVQAPGAFDQTMAGLLNLGRLGQRIELRVVLQRHTAPVIVEIADFIRRNLPFVEHVALMGLEMMGLARPNVREVWIDPYDYRQLLSEAVLLLNGAGIPARIYNHQLCTLEQRVWPYAVQSISDWKNEYKAICQSCEVIDRCGGFFHSANFKSSEHIHPTRLVPPPRRIPLALSSA
jgi:His-Xaa-Ser system radical SAM maturase HxsC